MATEPRPIYSFTHLLIHSFTHLLIIMQNKPNLLAPQMNVSSVLTKDYENETLGERGKNKAKTNPNKPNF